MPNFPKNEHSLPLDTHTYVYVSGVKKCSFFGKFDVLCFLENNSFLSPTTYHKLDHKGYHHNQNGV